MNLKLYALRDQKLANFSQPFVCPTEAGALRMVSDLVNSGQDMPVCKHPEDFELYCLGTWDDDTARIESSVVPIILCSSLVRSVQ